MSLLRSSCMLLVGLTLLTGFAYPLAVTGISQILFPRQADGSLLRDGDRVLGSELIGQPFDEPGWFWGRPSATAPHPYNAAASTGSNQGPSSPALHDAVRARIEALRAADPGSQAPVPVDLVTASGSGLDPHVTPAAALFQVRRVARARGLDAERVRALVEARIEGRSLGLLGERRVNVLLLNADLERLVRDGG